MLQNESYEDSEVFFNGQSQVACHEKQNSGFWHRPPTQPNFFASFCACKKKESAQSDVRKAEMCPNRSTKACGRLSTPSLPFSNCMLADSGPFTRYVQPPLIVKIHGFKLGWNAPAEVAATNFPP